jgi:hypothetical protein
MTAKRVPGNDIEDVTREVSIRTFKRLDTFLRKKPFGNLASGVIENCVYQVLPLGYKS